MTIQIQRGLRGRIVELADSLVLMVNTPSNPAAARASLERLAVELSDWGAKFVSEVVQSPIGALVLTDAAPIPVHLLRELPDRIVAHLRGSGVDSGEISLPNQYGPLNRLNVPRAVFLRLMPQRIVGRDPFGGNHQIPPSWLSEAVDWIDGYEGNGSKAGRLWAEAGGAQFPLEPSGIAALLADGYKSHTGKYCVIASDQLVPERFSDDNSAHEFVRDIRSLRGTKACFGPLYPYVELAIGGLGPSDQDLYDAIEQLKMIA